jgi:hypothetical protein
MAVRVRDFSRTHRSADATYASVLGRLESAITRMEALAGQQLGGYLSKHSSTVRRKELRRRLHGGLRRHLVTVAADAASENQALMEVFRLPAANATNKAFQTLARKMLEQGQAQKELLAKHGLADRRLDDLGTAVNEFDASVAETNRGRQDHVLARAEMDALGDEVMRLVGMLDGLAGPAAAGGVGVGEACGDGAAGGDGREPRDLRGAGAGGARGGEAGGVGRRAVPGRRAGGGSCRPFVFCGPGPICLVVVIHHFQGIPYPW